ncbi:MAG: hypothetical protein ISS32_01860 [Candidatus Omnitrophica bacterium]|nr:hypothetical protein [Candidatus Omnitrophota bacterium]MBL7210512.1 hypothetical protein [Candidatus Omnitrophota bacterium]
MKLKRFVFICGLSTLVCGLLGCDAFVRKFTRPPKKKAASHEDMVLVPEEYKNINKEQVYRQYFVFWESWMDELINALRLYPNYKKRVDCMERALKNLVYLKTLLNQDVQQKLDVYIARTIDLQAKIKRDPYGDFADDCATEAERLQLEISRDFSYSAVKNSIVQ